MNNNKNDFKKAQKFTTEVTPSWSDPLSSTLMEDSDLVVIVLDEQGRFVKLNRAATVLTGWEERDLVGKLFWGPLIPTREKNKAEQIFSKVKTENTSHKFSGTWISATGTSISIELKLVSSTAARGNVPFVIGMGGCIQKHLRSSYKNEQIAQGGVPTDSIFRVRSQLMEYALSHTLSEVLQVTLDAAEDFSNSSVAFYHFLEQDQETLSLQAWSTRTLADFCEAEGFGLHYPVSEAGVWGDAIRQRKPVIHNDYPNMTDKRGMPEGHAELIRELVVPIMRQDKIVAILGVGNKPTAYTEHDVTAVTVIADIAWEIVARKQAEQEVMRKAEQLARSNKELENFAYVASHDLQEPLRMVTSYLRLVERRYKNQLDEAGIEFIEYAVDGSKRMKNLIDHLLDYSRVNTRGKPFEKLDLNQIIKQVLFDLQFKIEEEAATITVDAFPTVMGDDVQLRSLIQNLVTNALKFRRDEPPVIHVGVREMKTEWLFSVEDNGIGIDPKFYERIFIIFQRLHQASEFSGTGIGLAISKRIVERHSGNIWVESKEGKGSTFYFTLPKALS